MTEPDARPVAEQGPEWFEAECVGDDAGPCGRTWSGRGTIESRDQRERAQKHADRTGHRVSAQHANVR